MLTPLFAETISLESILIAGIIALATVVTFLFSLLLAFFKSVEKRLSDCETDRKALWKVVAKLENPLDQERG